jgi:hypothetical protein
LLRRCHACDADHLIKRSPECFRATDSVMNDGINTNPSRCVAASIVAIEAHSTTMNHLGSHLWKFPKIRFSVLLALVDFWLSAATAIDFPKCFTTMLAGQVIDDR